MTPLLLAAKHGHVSVINTLIECGANVSQVDDEHNNCLDLAIERGNK